MKKTLIAVAVAALSLPAAAAFHERTWLDNVAYFDDASGITWLDGLLDEYGIYNERLYVTSFSSAPTLPQLVSLNVARNTFGDPFEHLLDRGPAFLNLPPHTGVWSSTTVPCVWAGTPSSPAHCDEVPEGAPFTERVPLVYSFGPGDGFWSLYQDDWPFKLSLRFAVGDVGTPLTSVVPEPGTWALMLAGVALIARRVRRSGTGHY